MIKQIKDTARSGVTLVELLVVILIVAILAVTMLPMFKKYVVQAQYTAEPIPLVGHIRTQIGLYQYEHNQLPFTYASGSEVFTFEKNTTGNGYKPGYYDVADTAYPSALTAITAETPLQKIDVAMNELVGKKISPDQVHLACVANDTAYCYAIGIFGKGDEGLPLNTGYAVMEAYFPTVQVGTRYVENNANAAENGYKLVAIGRIILATEQMATRESDLAKVAALEFAPCSQIRRLAAPPRRLILRRSRPLPMV